MLTHRNEECKDFICVNFEVCKCVSPLDYCPKCPYDNECTSKNYYERVRCFNDKVPCSPCSINGLCMLCERYKYCTRDDKIGYFGGLFNGLRAVEDYD